MESDQEADVGEHGSGDHVAKPGSHIDSPMAATVFEQLEHSDEVDRNEQEGEKIERSRSGINSGKSRGLNNYTLMIRVSLETFALGTAGLLPGADFVILLSNKQGRNKIIFNVIYPMTFSDIS